MFLAAYDVLAPDVDIEALKALLRRSPVFAAWWHHIPGCTLVVSDQDADAIVDEFRTVTGEASLLVIEVDPDHYEGWLAPGSWEWLTNQREKRANKADLTGVSADGP